MSDNIERYRNDIARFKYSAAERQALTEDYYGEQREAESYRMLVESLLWLPYSLALRFWRTRNTQADLEDLVQAGNIAMMAAIKSWKPGKGAKLTTWIRWACDRDMQRESIATAVVRHSAYEYTYDTVEVEEYDALGYNDEVLALDTETELWEASADMLSAVSGLDPAVSDAVTQLYVQGRTLREVADNMKISHTQVARLRDQGLSDLREKLHVTKMALGRNRKDI